jgi:hypothetical protein
MEIAEPEAATSSVRFGGSPRGDSVVKGTD